MSGQDVLQLIREAHESDAAVLDLSNRQLTCLPPEMAQLSELKSLYLARNRLTSLPPGIGRLGSLQSLELSGNHLTTLPPEIGQLASLENLYLAGNQLTTLPAEMVQLTRLRAFVLRANLFTALPPGIGQLTSLQRLNLAANHLSSLPPEIGQLTNLQSLRLRGNHLTSLPPEIARLTSLRSLQLRDNQLISLPPEIGQLTSLRGLNVRDNQLTSLPSEIGHLTCLQSLNLRANLFTALPPGIGQLTNLQSLHLTGNRLTSLPPEIGQLTNLRSLHLTGNHLTSLPPEIGQLTNLRSLHLTGNQLTSLPGEIGQLTNLQSLDLEHNSLTALPCETGRLASLRSLNLGHNQLTTLPSEIGQLASVRTFNLRDNQLSTLPPEIGRLANLQGLYMQRNHLSALPPEMGRLTSLRSLNLGDNQLATMRPEIGQLASLQSLQLGGNHLNTLPPEIGRLASLQSLHLAGNHLNTLPPEIAQLTDLHALSLGGNQFASLPCEIAQLTGLHTLSLGGNQLTSLPPEMAQLTGLQTLSLGGNQLTTLPPEIAQLTSLEVLNVWANRLTTLPSEIAQLNSLESLNLGDNQLAALPPEIGQLTSLKKLYLASNELATVPAEMGQLDSLESLNLENNRLTTMPLEMAELTSLLILELRSNPLSSPPPEIVQQGTAAILTYLRERLEFSVEQWVSKLLVVGEGGVGKTSVVRALLGEEFDAHLSTTHGIQIRELEMPHSTEPRVTMRLNAWDFGGQQIYHATHQFFLTNRSLFLLVWNARHGYEQGKLYHWLDTINALAPESPVLLVATHIDERDADLPFSDLVRTYPQIIGRCEVSNLEGLGIEELRDKVGRGAAGLPLMGELWPATWLTAAEAVRATAERQITPSHLRDILLEHNVGTGEQAILARWLHELGDILYFQEQDELKDVVILQPQWVSAYISRVLESKEVVTSDGIFTRSHMDELWSDLNPAMRGHFLNLMERFDLSYRTLENREISLVVERLPLDPPDYETAWRAISERDLCHEIAMRFYLSTIPAGIPTWFIARSHRFTTHTHWRQGALFADGPEREHLALVEAFPHERYLQLAVRGPSPHNFFALLKDGIELTLNRLPGLRVDCKIPCPGHDGEPCSHEFDHDQLIRRLHRRPDIECPESMEDVSVVRLLFGVHWSDTTEGMVLSRLDELEDTIVPVLSAMETELRDLRELLQREFTKAFRLQQSKIESHCPNIFALRPRRTSDWRKAIAGRKVDLQLYCQAPGQWHPTERGGLYHLDEPAEWFVATAPYIRRLMSVLKFATPLINPVLGVALPDYSAIIRNDLDLMEQLVQVLPDLQEDRGARLARALHETADDIETQRAVGAALRALRLLLDEKDPGQHWGGLRKVLTPEGHYLWLCETHALAYAQ